jgi:uncharacterized membrane protein
MQVTPTQEKLALSGFRPTFPTIFLSKGRLEALSDGIFAIVMTLLVLDLRVPDLPRHAAQYELLGKLRELAPQFFSFTTTFVLAGVFWLFHHMSFHNIRHVTRALVWINVGFLMFVSLLPFSTAMLGRFQSLPAAVMIYFGNQFVLAAFLKLQWLYVKRADLLQENADVDLQHRLSSRLTLMLLGHFSAMVTAFFEPLLAFDTFVLVLVVPLAIARKRERARQKEKSRIEQPQDKAF